MQQPNLHKYFPYIDFYAVGLKYILNMLLKHHFLQLLNNEKWFCYWKQKFQELIFIDYFFMLISTVYVITSFPRFWKSAVFAVTNFLHPGILKSTAYLHIMPFNFQKVFDKFQISNHCLLVKICGWLDISFDEKWWTCCSSNHIK